MNSQSPIAQSEPETKVLNSTADAPECVKIFVPGPMINFYKELKKYIKDNGKEPPKSDYLPENITSTFYAWTGTAATNQPYALAALAVIEKHLKEDLEELLLLGKEKMYIAENFKKSLLKDVYLAARELPKILKEMPAETITFTFLKPGSKIRKSLTNVISFYESELKEHNFPHVLDVHNDEDHQLSHMLKSIP